MITLTTQPELFKIQPANQLTHILLSVKQSKVASNRRKNGLATYEENPPPPYRRTACQHALRTQVPHSSSPAAYHLTKLPQIIIQPTTIAIVNKKRWKRTPPVGNDVVVLALDDDDGRQKVGLTFIETCQIIGCEF